MKNKSLAGDAAKLTVAKVFTTFITLLITMFLSRFRTLQEYGTYSQMLLVINLVITISMLGLPNSINFFLAREESIEGRQKFLSVYYSISTLLSFFSGIIMIILIPFLEKYFNNPLIRLFWYFLLIYPWTRIIQSSIENLLVVMGKIRKLIKYRMIQGLIGLLLVVIAWFFQVSFSVYLWWFVICETVFSIFVYIMAYNCVGKLRFSLDKHIMRCIFKFSIPIGFASIVGTLNIEIDKLLIGMFYNTQEMAIYANASRELPLTMVSAAITAVLLPQMTILIKEGKTKKATELWGESVVLSFVFMMFFVCALVVFAPEVITILYSRKYLEGVSVFRIYTSVLLLRVTYFGMILNALGKTKFILYSSILSLILNSLLNIIFYYMFGFIGPALATFISLLATVIFQLMYTSKEIKINFSNLFPWMKLFKISCINIVLSAIIIFIKKYSESYIGQYNLFFSIMLGIAWLVLYALIMKKFIKKSWKGLTV